MPEISIKAEHLFEVWHIPVTNSMLLALVVAVFLIVIALFLNKSIRPVPGKIQSILELLIEQILDLMETVFGDRKRAEKYLPLVATIFLFILFSNWFGLLPIVGPIGMREIITNHEGTHETIIPLFRAPSADLNFTIGLGIVSVFAVNFLSALALGIGGFLKRFFSKDPILTSVGFLEIVSEFVKIVSFSFRLFGNVFAGEVLLIIVGSLVPAYAFFVPLPFLFLEVFVGFMQAFIFAMLTMVFLAMATTSHSHGDEQHEIAAAH